MAHCKNRIVMSNSFFSIFEVNELLYIHYFSSWFEYSTYFLTNITYYAQRYDLCNVNLILERYLNLYFLGKHEKKNMLNQGL